MKKILIYSNCAGNVIHSMFSHHSYTKNKVFVDYICNYENLQKKSISNNHLKLIQECDIFIYQPLNKDYNESQYDIKNIIRLLKTNVKVIKINYYRFRGFWYKCTYIPYTSYKKYSFHKVFGLYDEISTLHHYKNQTDVIEFMNNIRINKDKLTIFFNEELKKFKQLDKKSDVNMYDFFLSNYKDKMLFLDPFHPSNIFFYEMFRQLTKMIYNHILPLEDPEFLFAVKDIEMTHWANPILPVVKQALQLDLPDYIVCFHKKCHPRKLTLSVYDYYYIRLAPKNFQRFLNTLN